MSQRTFVSTPETLAKLSATDVLKALGLPANEPVEWVRVEQGVALRALSPRQIAAMKLYGMGETLTAGRDLVAELVAERAREG